MCPLILTDFLGHRELSSVDSDIDMHFPTSAIAQNAFKNTSLKKPFSDASLQNVRYQDPHSFPDSEHEGEPSKDASSNDGKTINLPKVHNESCCCRARRGSRTSRTCSGSSSAVGTKAGIDDSV